jgi:ABC-type lipoprotein release transport system permease subunit
MNSYIKIAWRNLVRNGRFSVINIAGLTIGIASTLLILLWVYNERNWDRDQAHYEDVYHVFANRDFNGEINTGSDMMYPLAQAAMESFPELKAAVVVDFGSQTLFTAGDTRIRRNTLVSSPLFFDVFSAEFLEGSASALREPDAVILTASTARALFGPGQAAGKIVKLNNDRNYTVRAVVADPPAASTVRYDAIRPFNPSDESTMRASTDWVNCGNRVFFRTQPGADIPALEKKTIALVRAKTGAENPTTRGSVILHPMAKWRLYEEFVGGKNTGGRIAYVKLFSLIAIVILLIACINFMNLSTARSEKRAREVGIRKTLGSARQSLVIQFITESLVMAAIACILSVLMVLSVKQPFEQLMGMELSLPLRDPVVYLFLGLIILATGLLAGSYPALYLSGFNPIRVLKGTYLPGRQAMMPRKVLVTTQFVISIVLISASLLIYQQIQYVKSRDIGYDPNNLIMVSSTDETQKNYEAFRNELVAGGLVRSMTRASSQVTELLGFTSGVAIPGAATQVNPVLGFLFAFDGFATTTGARVIEGRDFRTGDTNTVMLNRAAVALMNLKDPVNREITWAGRTFRIVGVLDNMVMESPFAKATPMMVAYEQRWSAQNIIRLNPGADPRRAIAAIEQGFRRHSPSYPFEYRFADEAFNAKFVNEQLIGKLSIIFTCLAIFVCCLGLFGLVSFTIEKRNKEIGVRKVLGASKRQLLYLMSKEFLVLVGIAFLLAIPAAWWALNAWLENYPYRTSLSPLLFFAVGAIILFVALFTVGLNAGQAALKSPVKTLRTE